MAYQVDMMAPEELETTDPVRVGSSQVALVHA